MKICPRCKIEKSFELFAKNKLKKDGLQSSCKECTNSYNKIRYDTYWKKQILAGNKRRAEFLRQKVWDYLSSHPCVDCGESNPIVLEFDHIGVKISSISTMVVKKLAWNTIQQEIDKCQVRCSNCHKKKTAIDFGWYKEQLRVS